MKPRQCFISYAHYDAKDFDRLLVHVKAAIRQFPGHVVWHDRMLRAGQKWHPEIQRALEASDIYVLLVTSDFLASDYIHEHEWPPILERHRTANALVLPVIVGVCPWEGYFQHNIQVLPAKPPKGVVPLRQWRSREEALGIVGKEISASIREHFGILPDLPGSSSPSLGAA